MNTISIACIGSGNMGFALMKGVAASGCPVRIGFTDADAKKAEAAAAALKQTVYGSNIEAAEKADYVFLAIKPQALEAVLKETAPVIQRRVNDYRPPALVSMAAGWSIDKIQAAVCGGSTKVPVARIMPNTPALVGKGLIVLARSPELGGERTALLETMLGGAGEVDRIEERYLNAVTGLSGSGPAFVYLFIDALADGGVLAGLPRDKAIRYATRTVFGSAAMVTETGKHPGELKDMVCSPAGTTIEGVAELEAGAFRSTIMRAVKAAWQRAAELS